MLSVSRSKILIVLIPANCSPRLIRPPAHFLDVTKIRHATDPFLIYHIVLVAQKERYFKMQNYYSHILKIYSSHKIIPINWLCTNIYQNVCDGLLLIDA
jgi:hypothetical protein